MIPALIMMAGTTGCGKTTVADAVIRRWPSFRHLEIDAIRKQMAGIPEHMRVARSPLHDGLYSHGMSSLAYTEMYRRMAVDLDAGVSVVADGAFRHRDRRAAAIAVGREAGAATLIFELRVDAAEQLRRLRTRYDAGESVSDAPPEVLAYHEQGWEPVDDAEADRVYRIDARPASEIVVATVIDAIAAAVGM